MSFEQHIKEWALVVYINLRLRGSASNYCLYLTVRLLHWSRSLKGITSQGWFLSPRAQELLQRCWVSCFSCFPGSSLVFSSETPIYSVSSAFKTALMLLCCYWYHLGFMGNRKSLRMSVIYVILESTCANEFFEMNIL